MRIVLDTNVLLMSIPKASPYRPIFDGLIQGKFQLLISQEILNEYVEIIDRQSHPIIAENIAKFLIDHEWVETVDVYYQWRLIRVC